MSAALNEPKSVALDTVGNLYIADSENHVIRQVNLEIGMIRTVAGRVVEPIRAHPKADLHADGGTLEEDVFGHSDAALPEQFAHVADLSGTVRFVVGTGSGCGGFQGDGEPAIHAALNFPSAVVVDEAGHLYIADTMNHRIRKVYAATGVIMTIAGTGQRRFSGDGGPATSAALNEPTALAIDHTHLYVADQSNHRVRQIDLMSGIITTVAGTGQAGYAGDGAAAVDAALSGPSGLALGPDGMLYIADTFNGRIRAVEPESGIIFTVAGDGHDYRYQGSIDEVSTSLARPYGIAIDHHGNLLITDSDSHLIRKWHRSKKVITCVAGNGTAGFGGDGRHPRESSLNFPFGVAVDARGNVYIADTFNHRIRIIAS